MGFAGKANIGGNDYPLASTLYGVCTTAGATAAKVVTCPDFDTLLVGITIAVKFMYTNTAADPTLNVNDTGALPIYVSGTRAPGTTPLSSWTANSIVNFTYDGNAWIMNDTVANAILDAVYPVGSIYMSVNSVSPATVLGGTWEQIKDKFLLSAGDTYAAGATGGSATKNLQHTHTTGGHALTEAELPKISGYFDIRCWSDGEDIFATNGKFSNLGYKGASSNQKMSYNNARAAQRIQYAFGGNGSHNHGNTGNGLGTGQDIMPPYLAVYVWKRTA